jgi:hypothetical protein
LDLCFDFLVSCWVGVLWGRKRSAHCEQVLMVGILRLVFEKISCLCFAEGSSSGGGREWTLARDR